MRRRASGTAGSQHWAIRGHELEGASRIVMGVCGTMRSAARPSSALFLKPVNK
jgi:hypothetical protein